MFTYYYVNDLPFTFNLFYFDDHSKLTLEISYSLFNFYNCHLKQTPTSAPDHKQNNDM